MNASMLDSYDLSWKLAYVLCGLSVESISLLNTYEIDRRRYAQDLIYFDKKWYSDVYGSKEIVMEPQDFLKAAADTTICGVEYEEGLLVDQKRDEEIRQGQPIDYTFGTLREGRRILDTVVHRFADSNPCHVHDELPSNGGFKVLVLTSSDLLDPKGNSWSTLISLCENTMPRYPQGTIGLIVLTHLAKNSFEWVDVPACLKREAEMHFHHADEGVYKTYGVDVVNGAMTVIRPDGMVGTVADLADLAKVDTYIGRVLRRAND